MEKQGVKNMAQVLKNLRYYDLVPNAEKAKTSNV